MTTLLEPRLGHQNLPIPPSQTRWTTTRFHALKLAGLLQGARVRGRRGHQCLELRVTYLAGRRHLPIIELEKAAYFSSEVDIAPRACGEVYAERRLDAHFYATPARIVIPEELFHVIPDGELAEMPQVPVLQFR